MKYSLKFMNCSKFKPIKKIRELSNKIQSESVIRTLNENEKSE